ncbi:copper chaperone PCu(A)C [Rhodococcus spongiicola]|uniref:Copper chaperone PCu(A)C n=1 Tax=Rhodococcus spongiicola TaxID=2487352 RepID=A0A3S3CV62_9NOCA|nr:copper chaperone PCu(A)C [Rhodococcus spongiicola]RVW06393.1 copper chaperone PCu(A)C [Rhodococcus spongiicola]
MKAYTRASVLSIGVALAAGLALAGCSSDSDETRSTGTDTVVSLQDSWVKAADSGMTAMFGTIVNDSDSAVTLTTVTTQAAPRVELHEMAADGTGAMKMREKDGGITVAAHSSHELAPGGDHIMLFDFPAPIQAGTDVDLTFTFADGATAEVTAQVRDFAGAREEYDSHGETRTETDDHGYETSDHDHNDSEAHSG